MRMLGTDICTQVEFDQFKAEEFDPLKVEVAKLAGKVRRLERLCLGLGLVLAITIVSNYIF